MNHERWAQIQKLFHEAAERPESEWRPFLTSAVMDSTDSPSTDPMLIPVPD